MGEMPSASSSGCTGVSAWLEACEPRPIMSTSGTSAHRVCCVGRSPRCASAPPLLVASYST
eukprot:1708699-Prymnesium_polylepis.1